MELHEVKVTNLPAQDSISFNDRFLTTFYTKTLKVVCVVWYASFIEEEYLKLFSDLFNVSRQYAFIGFYSDIEEQAVVPIVTGKKFEENFSPKGKATGMDKTGVVTNAFPFKKYYLNTIVKITGLPIKLTSNPEEAPHFALEGKL